MQQPLLPRKPGPRGPVFICWVGGRGRLPPAARSETDSLGGSRPRPTVHTCENLSLMPSREQITEKLTQVIDPELRRSIVELGMVRSIDIQDDGRVDVVVSLTTPGCPI